MKHIRLFIFLILSIIGISAVGQKYDLDLTARMLQNNGKWKKNSIVKINKFVHSFQKYEFSSNYSDVFYLLDDQGNRVDINSKVNDCFDFELNNIQQLWDANIITNVLYNLKKYGFQYDVRHEMENEALDYIYKIKDLGLEFNDPYLETYIYSLVAKIAPTQLIDGRPGSINILIQNNPSINAACYPNGTIVLNTGLLALLHSEDELVAILAHEIAHFVLDHSIQNVNEAIARQKRAEFWAALATGLTAVAEGFITANNPYYIPGGATLGMAILASNIASNVIDHLGMNYNHEQEEEADRIAIQALKILGYDEGALATALTRLVNEYIAERNNAAYLNSYSHPDLLKRISNAGTCYNLKDKKFEQIISFAVSSVALMKYTDCRFRQCLPYVNQNIENNVACADDYILKANCLLSTQNNEDSNKEVLELINKAKSLNEENINIYKTEIIATLRLDNIDKAQDLLQQYIQKLNAYNLSDIQSDETWDKLRNFIIAEKEWANNMSIKLRAM